MGNIKTGYRLRPVNTVTRDGYATAPGYPSSVKGLSIVQDFTYVRNVPHEQRDARNGRGGAWNVTHTNSGRRLAPASWRLSRAEAVELAERLGEFASDWDVCKDAASLIAWAPGLVEYFDGFAEEHDLPKVHVVNGPARHEVADVVNIKKPDGEVISVERESLPKPFDNPPVERHVENAPAFTGEEDPNEPGRPAAPAGWGWAESGFDSYVICPCGDTIEQDGKCPAGHVSFLRQWGFI